MAEESLAAVLEQEHHDIDAGLESFIAGNPAGRDDLVRSVAALRRHIYVEEEFVFPLLRDPGLAAPVFVMLREHAQIWQTLDALELALDAEADAGSAATLGRQLLVQLQHHNLKEERVIYPQADLTVPAPTAARLRQLLDSGVVPDGWICRKLRS